MPEGCQFLLSTLKVTEVHRELYNINMQKTKHDSETPAQGKQVITACAFVHHNFDGVEKVFLPKRASTKKFLPNVHELPGGHIDFGEDIESGLKREIREEFDMNVKVGDPFFVFTYLNEIKGSHSIEVIYYATFTDPIEMITLNPEDHSEFSWFAESELGKVTNNLKEDSDPELKAIIKGFELLNGDRFNFGN
jgi:8-oxo-dGTP diphosphatase